MLTTGLAACGSDGDPQAKAPAATVAAPASTPLTKAQQAAANKVAAANLSKAKAQAEKLVAKNIPTVNASPETTHTIAIASAKPRSTHSMNDDIATAQKALAKAGQTATRVKVTGGASAAIQIKNTTVVFFSSDKKAASSDQTFTLAIAANPDYGRIARTNNRVYLVSSGQKISAGDIAAFKSVQSIVDKAL
jgi:hypothetical protein